MSYYLYVGTYTGGELSDHKYTASKGIYCFNMNPATGQLSNLRSFGEHEIDPGFLAVRGRFLFGENERKDIGTVRSFLINQDGSLKLIDRMETEGSKCAFISTDAFGPYVFATNYASGSLVVMRCEENGKLKLTDQIQHYGRSVVPLRQDCPRAHSVKQTPDGLGLLVPDLGIDMIMSYILDRDTGRVRPNENQASIRVDPGEGPRHIVFRPDGKYVYLNTEIGNHVYVYSYCPKTRTLQEIQKISLLPEEYKEPSYCAEILTSSDGEYIYVANRGYDTITCFHSDKQSGYLTLVGQFSSGGKGPRHICLGPDESYMICANKDNDNITVLERDKQTGKLGKVRFTYDIPAPSCIVWKEV